MRVLHALQFASGLLATCYLISPVLAEDASDEILKSTIVERIDPTQDASNPFADAIAKDAAEAYPATAGTSSAADTASAQTAGGRELLGNEMNPAVSIIVDSAGAFFYQADHRTMGGHAPASSGLFLTGAELASSANIDPYFSFNLAFNLAEVELEEAYLTTLALPANIQMRAGQFLSRIGRHNNTHPHTWHFALSPLSLQYLFGPEGLGAPGFEASWLAPLPWYAELIFAVQHGAAGTFGQRSSGAGEPRLGDLIYPVRLQQFFDLGDDFGLQLGTNAVFGPSAYGADLNQNSRVLGADCFLKWRPIGEGQSSGQYIALQSEFWQRTMDLPADLWKDYGAYLDVLLGLDARWEAGIRGEFWQRYGGSKPTDFNGRAALGLNSRSAAAVLTFLPSHFSKIRLQYTVEDIEGLKLNQIAMVQVEISAGAHGAHSY